jgi:serine/threonine protein kinase
MGASIPFDLWPPFQIQRTLHIKDGDIDIPLVSLPRQYIDGSIRVNGKERCKIIYGTVTNRGGYGNIYRCKRVTSIIEDICVKVPHNTSFSLCSEGVLQWIASETLRSIGIKGAIPEMCDIFQYAGETRISMKYVKGVSSIEYILNSPTPEITFIQIIVQACCILAYLEEKIYLDHRDLKADNLWIRNRPVTYEIPINGKVWKLSAPFQVVVLDFGFGCLGSADGNSVISLSDGILPKLDPCPKEGRDIFQLFVSLWSFKSVRERMSPTFQAEIDTLLSYKNKPYTSLIKQGIDTRWVYLLVSNPAFKYPPLSPLSLLHAYSIKYDSLYISSE